MISNFRSYVVKAVGPWASRDSGHNHYSGMCMGALDHNMNAKLKEGKRIHIEIWWGRVNTPRSVSRASSSVTATTYCGGKVTNTSSSRARLGWVAVDPVGATQEQRERGGRTQQQRCILNRLARWNIPRLGGAAAARVFTRRLNATLFSNE